MKNYLIESMYSYMGKLEEARNPENDEINAAIKRYLSSDKAYIPKKDKELFNKYGVTPDKLSKKFGSQKIVTGAGGRNGSTVISTDTMLNLHPDYDYANSLTKKKLSGGDIEQPTNDMRYYVNILNQRPDTRTSEDTSKMSWNQLKSLQPYIDEKSRIINSNEDIKRAKQREAEQIEQIKQDTQRQIGYKQKDKDDTMRRAKAKHNARNKNESLSLKEDVNRDSTWKKVYDFLENELDNFEGSQITTYDISMKIPEYNPEWCGESPTYEYDTAKKEYITALTDTLFTYRDIAEE